MERGNLDSPVEIRVWSRKDQAEVCHQVALEGLQSFLEHYPDPDILDLYWDDTGTRVEIYIEEKPCGNPNMWHTEIFGDGYYFLDMVPSVFFVPFVQKLRGGFQAQDVSKELEDFILAMHEKAGTKPLIKRWTKEEWAEECARRKAEVESPEFWASLGVPKKWPYGPSVEMDSEEASSEGK